MNEKILQDYEVSPLMEPKMVESEPDLTPPARPASQDDVFAQRGSRQDMNSGDEGGGGGGDTHPFRLTVSKVGAIYYWNVSSVGSTITNGTNGASIAIANMDTDTAFTAAKYIVAQATVTSLVLGAIAISAVDDPEEVDRSGTPTEQDTIRYLIGKVDVVDNAPTKEQHALTAARLTYGFLNAKLVRVFEFAPTHLG